MTTNRLRKLKIAVAAGTVLPVVSQSCTVDVNGLVQPRSFSGVIDVFVDDRGDDDFFDDLGDFFDDLDDAFDDNHHRHGRGGFDFSFDGF